MFSGVIDRLIAFAAIEKVIVRLIKLSISPLFLDPSFFLLLFLLFLYFISHKYCSLCYRLAIFSFHFCPFVFVMPALYINILMWNILTIESHYFLKACHNGLALFDLSLNYIF